MRNKNSKNPMSDETKKKISISQKKRYKKMTEEERISRNKKISDYQQKVRELINLIKLSEMKN